MYEYISHYKCKHCGNTDCLFKLRKDEYYYKKTGNIRYKSTSTCKICYLEDCLIKNSKSYPKNRESILLQQKFNRIINKVKYNKRAKGYYKKRREKALEQKRMKYISVKKNKGILDRVKYRDSLVLFRR